MTVVGILGEKESHLGEEGGCQGLASGVQGIPERRVFTGGSLCSLCEKFADFCDLALDKNGKVVLPKKLVRSEMTNLSIRSFLIILLIMACFRISDKMRISFPGLEMILFATDLVLSSSDRTLGVLLPPRSSSSLR